MLEIYIQEVAADSIMMRLSAAQRQTAAPALVAAATSELQGIDNTIHQGVLRNL